jgi:hypothetical protein
LLPVLLGAKQWMQTGWLAGVPAEEDIEQVSCIGNFQWREEAL